MRRMRLGLFFLFLFAFLASCKGGKTSSTVKSVVDKGYTFKIKNVEFVINEDPTEKIKQLKVGSETFDAKSCADKGRDKIYIYSGFTLNVNEDKTSRLTSILLTDDSVETCEGLYIGQDKNRVREIYGEPKINKNEFIYKKGNMELSIIFKEDKIISIEYRTEEKIC